MREKDESTVQFGHRVRQLRKSLGLTQAEFANRIGLSGFSSVASMESGVTRSSVNTRQMICSKFNVSPMWLENGVGPMLVEPESDEEKLIARYRDASPEVRTFMYSLFCRSDEELVIIQKAFMDLAKSLQDMKKEGE